MRTEAENLIKQTNEHVVELRASIDEIRPQIVEGRLELRSVELAPVDADKIRQRAAAMVEKAAAEYTANLRFIHFAMSGELFEAACWKDMNGADPFGLMAKLFPEAVREMIVSMAQANSSTLSCHCAVSDDDRSAALRAVLSKISLLEAKEELALRKLERAGDRSRVRRPDAPDLSHITFGALEARCTGQPRERV